MDTAWLIVGWGSFLALAPLAALAYWNHTRHRIRRAGRHTRETIRYSEGLKWLNTR